MKNEITGNAMVVNQPERTRSMRCGIPAVDIVETSEAIELLADMPGVGSDGVNATVENGVLTIEGNAAIPGVEGSKLAYAEFNTVDFKRSFSLSDSVNHGAITASMKDGVLRVVMPKARETLPRRIVVQKG